MTVPTVEVIAYFDLSADGGDYFTLNDSTKGVLDSATYVLGGDVATDVTGYVSGFSTSRGRSWELDEFAVGTAQVTLHNYDGDLVPEGFVVGGTYDSEVAPGKRVQIKCAGHVVFDGRVQDWDFAYDASIRNADVSFSAEDALGALGRRTLDEWTTTAGQRSGDRIAAMLARSTVDWGANVDLDTGITPLQADTVDAGTNALSYGQLVARTESGRLFCSRDGVLTYRERYNTIGLTSQSASLAILDEGGASIFDESADEIDEETVPFTANPAVNAVVSFTDDGSGVPFSTADLSYGSTGLFTDVTVTRVDGTVQSSSNSTAQSEYGRRRLDLTGLLMQSDTIAASMAEWLCGRYSSPSARFSALSVPVHKLTSAQQASVVRLDVASVVTVQWTPRGAAAQLDMDMVVEGVAHSASVSGEYWVTLALSPVSGAEVFRLDDDVLGVLDSGVLAY